VGHEELYRSPDFPGAPPPTKGLGLQESSSRYRLWLADTSSSKSRDSVGPSPFVGASWSEPV
jgi:hypothetical protein